MVLIFCRRRLAQEISSLKGKLTPHELADVQEKQNSLAHRIQQWREVQFAYTPIVATLFVSDLANSDLHSRPRNQETSYYPRLSLPHSETTQP